MKRYKLQEKTIKQIDGNPNLTSYNRRSLQSLLEQELSKKQLLRFLDKEEFSKEQSKIVLSLADRYTLNRITTRVKYYLGSQYFAGSRFMGSLFSSILLRPISFSLYFRIRYVYFLLFCKLKKFYGRDESGFEHNFKQVNAFHTGLRERTECLILILKCITPMDIKKNRILTVGPRNEAEVLLFRLHGFKNVTAIDLFSYSPLIKIMDMNSIKYPDNSFDIYYSSFVLTYSTNIRQAINEAIRVTKHGGIHVFGFTTPIGRDELQLTPDNITKINKFTDFEKIIHNNIDCVYWRNTWESDHPSSAQLVHTIVYRVLK